MSGSAGLSVMSEPSSVAEEISATFRVDLQPSAGELAGTSRHDFTKVWAGGMDGASRGIMLSAGDPGSGTAGYVALETFDGNIGGRRGTIALQQFGTMGNGEAVLRYELVPGSGTGELAGFGGVLELVAGDGTHEVVLRWWQGQPDDDILGSPHAPAR